MCRWGCQTVDTTYMCRWCGTRYCAVCLKGDFVGTMKSPERCRKCFQENCQGQKVEFKPQRSPGKNKTTKSKKSKPSTKKKSTSKKKKRKKKR